MEVLTKIKSLEIIQNHLKIFLEQRQYYQNLFDNLCDEMDYRSSSKDSFELLQKCNQLTAILSMIDDLDSYIQQHQNILKKLKSELCN